MQDGGYPAGAAWDDRAPYNQVTHTPMNIEVDIVITMSKKVKIAVNDYEIDEDEKTVSFENADMYKHVHDQVTLPTETEYCKDWTVDDLQILY